MTTRRVIVAPAASADVAEIVDYLLAHGDVDSALAADDRIHDALESLERHAERGRIVPELRAVGRFREILALPYRIIYRVDPQQVAVVAVVDHRRDVEALLARRLRR